MLGSDKTRSGIVHRVAREHGSTLSIGCYSRANMHGRQIVSLRMIQFVQQDYLILLKFAWNISGTWIPR